MRMNYVLCPTDYIQSLKQNGNRKKARCFQEYFTDMDYQEHNSYGFYAKSWEVSKSTAHTWIDEFKYEIGLFADHWHLKNQQHYSYAKNIAERLPNDCRTKIQPIAPTNTEVETNEKTTAERQPNKALNNINNNKTHVTDKDFIDLYFVYSRNTKYVGKKPDAYQAFANCDVDVNLLKLSCMKYLHDSAVDRPVGIKKFLENELYLPYLPTYMRVKSNEQWYEGEYNRETFELKDVEGKSLGTIEPKLLVELYERKELIYLKTLDKKVS